MSDSSRLRQALDDVRKLKGDDANRSLQSLLYAVAADIGEYADEVGLSEVRLREVITAANMDLLVGGDVAAVAESVSDAVKRPS